MRKFMTVLVTTGALVMLAASPVGAKDYSDRSPEAAACLIGAITWDGQTGSVVTDIVVKTRPFPGLAVNAEKPLRKIVRSLAGDSQGIVPIAQFGKWCKAHFPKVGTIKRGVYEAGF